MNFIRPGMGTENASKLLATLVRMYRPNIVLEIGAGDSTIALAHALQDATADWEKDREALTSPVWSERVALLDPAGIPDKYAPKLITVDDFSGEGSSAEAAWARLETTGVRRSTVQFIKQDFFSITRSSRDEWGQLDLVWVDAGTPADDVRFVTELWDRIRPGGFLVLHEPTMLSTVQRNNESRLEVTRNPLWEELAAGVNGKFELITLPEPHKYRQSGIGLVRKRRSDERSIRPDSLQNELLTLGEAPIRNDFIPSDLRREQSDSVRPIIGTLSDADARRVYAAVTLGSGSLTAISSVTGLTIKAAGKAITKLLSATLISSSDGEFRVEDAPWHRVETPPSRDTTNISDTTLESPKLLERIAAMFIPGQQYPEAVVSSMCAMVTTDFARLRRKLVDDGYLKRIDSIYQRS